MKSYELTLKILDKDTGESKEVTFQLLAGMSKESIAQSIGEVVARLLTEANFCEIR